MQDDVLVAGTGILDVGNLPSMTDELVGRARELLGSG